MSDLFTRFVMWLAPRYVLRNGVSENMLRKFFSHVLNPKNILLNWLLVRSEDFLHEKMIRRYNEVMTLPRNGVYDEELRYLAGRPFGKSMFPYERVKPAESAVSGVEMGLPYVTHKGRKLFFPKLWDKEIAESQYRYFIEEEGITGAGHLRKSPHSYTTESFAVEKGDILLDVGSAEGLFPLDNVDVASKVYVFESLKDWRKPLHATFAPFGDKVVIINKYVGKETTNKTIKLSDVVGSESSSETFFIKMDVEGSERDVILGSESFLRTHRVKLACAAYHRQDDAEVLKTMLESMGFSVAFSDGYMIPLIDDFVYPYFRRGMIYARNY